MQRWCCMSKKKQRYNKRKKAKKLQYNGTVDNHHLLFYRRLWIKSSASVLRRHWYCIVPIAKSLHSEIHARVKGVPVPKKVNVEGVMFQLNLLERFGAIHPYDPIERRLKILIALFECSEQPTADALKHQLEICDRFNKPS